MTTKAVERNHYKQSYYLLPIAVTSIVILLVFFTTLLITFFISGTHHFFNEEKFCSKMASRLTKNSYRLLPPTLQEKAELPGISMITEWKRTEMQCHREDWYWYQTSETRGLR